MPDPAPVTPAAPLVSAGPSLMPLPQSRPCTFAHTGLLSGRLLLPLCSQLSQYEGLISPAQVPYSCLCPHARCRQVSARHTQETRHMYGLSGIPRAQRARRLFPPCRPPPASNRKPHIRAEAHEGAWLVPPTDRGQTETRSGSLPCGVTDMHSGGFRRVLQALSALTLPCLAQKPSIAHSPKAPCLALPV